jgi:hypothetical protein
LEAFEEFSLCSPNKNVYRSWFPDSEKGNDMRKIILEFCIQMTYKP